MCLRRGMKSEEWTIPAEDVVLMPPSTTLPRSTYPTRPATADSLRGEDIGMGNGISRYWIRVWRLVQSQRGERSARRRATERQAAALFNHNLRQAYRKLGPPPGYSDPA